MQKLCIQTAGSKHVFLDPSAVVMIEACLQICYFNLVDGSRIAATQHLGYYKTRLLQHFGFWEISKSILVNSSHVSKYEPRERLLTLSNGHEISIPKQRIEYLNKILKALHEAWEQEEE